MTRYFVEVTLPDETTKIVEVSEVFYKMLTGEMTPTSWFNVENRFGKGVKVRPLTYTEAKTLGMYDYLRR